MLRHKVLFDAMEAVDRSVEKREVLQRFKPPVKVEFRRGGDLKGVLDAVRGHRSVELCAAVGSGKSTKVPLLLAKGLGCLVIHTIPFAIAAQHLAEYLAQTDDGDRVVYMDDLQSDLPQHGVVIMTNAFMHARMARDNFYGVQDAVLYMDETHESDAPTAVLRDVAPAMRMFRCVVKATATLDPGATYKPTLPGTRVEKVYPKTAVATWRSDDMNMPWSASSINGNVLMAIDRESTRVRLAAEYREHGFDVRVCLKSTPYEYFKETIHRLRDPAGGIVIVMVDYAFRSSLTIPQLSRVVDSCEVAVPTVDNGRPSVIYRSAYDFEVQQLFGRGARLPGENVELWRSAEPSPKRMCDLEALECDAANLLYRVLGFRPPIKLINYAFYEGPVPIDIAASMRSDHPLRLCPSESRVPWVNGHLALLHEDRMSDYVYDKSVRARPKPVSCHTVYDRERSVSPPPPVPVGYRQTAVDIDGLEAYSSSRASSPSLGSVYTLKSELPDNLSVFEDGEFAAFAKPKRVAKRVLEERAAKAAAVAEQASLASPVSSDFSATGGTMAHPPNLPAVVPQPVVQPSADVVSGVPLARAVTTVARPRMEGATAGVRHVHDRLVEKQGEWQSLSDSGLGEYVYYHDMDKAPETSNYFLRGVDKILTYCEQHNAKMYARALPDHEKLFAMRELVNACNNSTAIAMGIQRLFEEVASRSTEDWQSMVDHDALVETLEWMAMQCTDAQLRVRMCRQVMPYFMRYDLDVVPPAGMLEQRVMIQMMEKFEKVAIKKDPDKVQHYMQSLNDRLVNVGARNSIKRRNALYLV